MTSHPVGRRSFAARLLAQDYTLKQMQKAGGWKPYKMVADTCGDLEKKHVDTAVRNSDASFVHLLGASETAARIQRAKR